MIRAIIIDDEPLAIESLEIILKKKCRDEVQVIATSNSPQLGRSLIEEHQPDLVFLDVEMPGMSGIDLVRSFSNPTFRVVFITAFDGYAIEALRLSAIDYLLKPVDPDALQKSIQKSIRNIQSKDLSRQIEFLLHQLSDKHEHEKRINHGIKGTTKVRSYIICIPKSQFHFHIKRSEIISHIFHPDPST